jgi:hypothetical protein
MGHVLDSTSKRGLHRDELAKTLHFAVVLLDSDNFWPRDGRVPGKQALRCAPCHTVTGDSPMPVLKAVRVHNAFQLSVPPTPEGGQHIIEGSFLKASQIANLGPNILWY